MSDSTQYRQPQNGLTEAHIRILWEKMAMLYGHRWTSAYGEADDGTWLSVLGDLTAMDLKTGLQACVASGHEWPPSAPGFRRACIGISEEPKCDDDWQILGRQLGVEAKPGESWPQLISRIRRAIQYAQRPTDDNSIMQIDFNSARE